MGVLEGMAAGLPVVTNAHPTTLVLHGVTGFVATTPEDMHAFAQQLLRDEALAHRMGQQARAYVARNFGPERFKVDFGRAIQEARKKWQRRAALPHPLI
jgi:glycosyltransferase involved in cell wall biosynthesis